MADEDVVQLVAAMLFSAGAAAAALATYFWRRPRRRIKPSTAFTASLSAGIATGAMAAVLLRRGGSSGSFQECLGNGFAAGMCLGSSVGMLLALRLHWRRVRHPDQDLRDDYDDVRRRPRDDGWRSSAESTRIRAPGEDLFQRTSGRCRNGTGLELRRDLDCRGADFANCRRSHGLQAAAWGGAVHSNCAASLAGRGVSCRGDRSHRGQAPRGGNVWSHIRQYRKHTLVADRLRLGPVGAPAQHAVVRSPCCWTGRLRRGPRRKSRRTGGTAEQLI